VEHNPQPYVLPNDAPWGGFINMRLDEEQKAEFYEWLPQAEPHVEGEVDDMLALGIKLSLSYDWQNQCFICSVTGALVGADRASRYTSTSRASTRHEVLALTVWKHHVLVEGDYGNFAPQSGAVMKWG
jgi:hypothetical protein